MTLAFQIGYLLVQVGLLVVAVTTLGWMLYAWRDDDSLERTRSQLVSGGHRDRGPALSFSLIVPARHEEQVLGATLGTLAGLDHDRFEVVVVVGHDDPATAQVAHDAADAHPGLIRVVIDHHEQKSKPRALNTAYPHCDGDVIAVFDAEDSVHPELLQMVERRMQLDDCAGLQAGVQLMNFWSSWYAVRNVLEYYFWFRSRLHLHADRGFIPLGGNTVFVRRNALELLGGWDPECLAEDCDLGVRLSSRGLRISVVYETALVTREEAPTSLKAFIRQRTRWNQGFLQVLCKRDWQHLPTRRQRLLAMYTLGTPFLQAVMGVLLPLSVAAAFLTSMPTLIAMASFLPLVPATMVLAVECLALHEFGELYGLHPRPRDYLRLTLGMPAYYLLLAWAAARSGFRQLAQIQTWEKTAHSGAHLSTTDSVTVRPSAPTAARTADRIL